MSEWEKTLSRTVSNSSIKRGAVPGIVLESAEVTVRRDLHEDEAEQKRDNLKEKDKPKTKRKSFPCPIPDCDA